MSYGGCVIITLMILSNDSNVQKISPRPTRSAVGRVEHQRLSKAPSLFCTLAPYSGQHLDKTGQASASSSLCTIDSLMEENAHLLSTLPSRYSVCITSINLPYPWLSTSPQTALLKQISEENIRKLRSDPFFATSSCNLTAIVHQGPSMSINVHQCKRSTRSL